MRGLTQVTRAALPFVSPLCASLCPYPAVCAATLTSAAMCTPPLCLQQQQQQLKQPYVVKTAAAVGTEGFTRLRSSSRRHVEISVCAAPTRSFSSCSSGSSSSSTSNSSSSSSSSQQQQAAPGNAGNTSTAECWSCREKLQSLPSGESAHDFFCAACKAVQPPCTSRTYFDALKSPKTFDLNQQQLERSYKRLQFGLHPDKFSLRSDREKEYSAAASAEVNKAYTTLKSPLQRASYLLELSGDASAHNSEVDPEFLMEMMEMNEAAEAVASKADADRIKQTVHERMDKTIEAISAAFKKSDISAAARFTVELRYLQNISNLLKQHHMQ